MVKILTQNVCKWRTRDIHSFCSLLLESNADVYAFTEHLKCSESDIAKALFSSAGYGFFYETLSSNGRKGSLLTVSRMPLTPLRGLTELNEDWRFQSFELNDYYLSFVYWPNSYAKASYWESLLRYVALHSTKPHLIMGDFNTGRNDLDKSDRGVAFVVTEYLDQLANAGFVDVWRHMHGSTREYSWYSSAGNGFRLDHAFASTELITSISACLYDHTPREAGYSDHSCLWLTLQAS